MGDRAVALLLLVLGAALPLEGARLLAAEAQGSGGLGALASNLQPPLGTALYHEWQQTDPARCV